MSFFESGLLKCSTPRRSPEDVFKKGNERRNDLEAQNPILLLNRVRPESTQPAGLESEHRWTDLPADVLRLERTSYRNRPHNTRSSGAV